MKLPRLLFVSGFLVIGCMVLGISLVKASDTISESSASTGTTWNGHVIPGHILYPVQVIRDKVSLMTMDEEHQCEFQVDLAQQRLEATKLLLEEKEYDRAVQTFYKGVLYLASALETSKQHPDLTTEYQAARDQLVVYQQFLHQQKQQFPDVHWSRIDQTVAYIEALLLHSPQLTSN